jgi:hypothetical protein
LSRTSRNHETFNAAANGGFHALTTFAAPVSSAAREPGGALAVLIMAPHGLKGTYAMRKILAALLIVGGIAALATPYITYTEKERVVDVGPIEVDAEKEKTIPIPQIAAVAAIIIGIGLLAMGSRSEV